MHELRLKDGRGVVSWEALRTGHKFRDCLWEQQCFQHHCFSGAGRCTVQAARLAAGCKAGRELAPMAQ